MTMTSLGRMEDYSESKRKNVCEYANFDRNLKKVEIVSHF